MKTSHENVLFLCTSNSARSQMAEALLRKHAGNRFNVYSAGLEAKPIHPLAIQVMNEIDIDISQQVPKQISDYLGRFPMSVAIFVCDRAQQNCPKFYPFALKTLSWPFEDPAAFAGTEQECIQKFREVRDQIEEKIKAWLVVTP